MEKGKHYNNELQSLRAIAICMVLISHLPVLFPWDVAQYQHIGKGLYIGVDLFLCLSGYVITKSFARNLSENSGEAFWRHVAAFWVRRWYRITPAAWLWLFLPLVVYSAVGGFSIDNVKTVVAALVHVANIQIFECAYRTGGNCGWMFTHYWSLSLEEQFYILLPLLFLVFRRRIHYALVVLVLAQLFLPRYLSNLATAIKTDAIMLGVLIALWSNSSTYRIFEPKIRQSALRYFLPPLLVALLIGVARYEIVPFFMGVAALICAVIVWVCSYDKEHFIAEGPLRRALSWIGERSFSIYLIHPFVYWGTPRLFARLVHRTAFDGTYTFRFAIAAIFLILLLSELNYRFVETPFRVRGAARSKRIAAPQSTDTATA